MKALLLCAALAGCGWSKQHVAMGAVSTAFLTVDWYQTMGITRDCQELNPAIGPCGERIHPDLWMIGAIAGHLALAHLVGAGWRPVVLGAMAGAEAATVWSNGSVE